MRKWNKLLAGALGIALALTLALPAWAADVPRTSLLREFIGGGCYQV